MTRQGVIVQGFLALLGLAFAYSTWQRDPDLDSGQSVVVDITKSDLQKIRYEDGENSFVELTAGKDDAGEFTLVRLSGKKGHKGAMPAGHPVVQTDVPERQLRGNEAALRMWKLFAPLLASRSLGVVDEARQKSLGLDKSKKKIHVTYRGITRSFALTPPPPGGTEPYLRALDDGRVYLVSNQIHTDFNAAQSNLVDRRFHGFLLQEFDELIVRDGGGNEKKRFKFKRFADGRPGGQLVPTGTDTPDTTAANWHERIFALFPAEVLGKGEIPAGGEPIVSMRLEYFYRGKRLGWTDLARSRDENASAAQAPSGASGETPPRTSGLARSELTAGWMRLAVEAQALVSEGETLFGASAPGGTL